MKRRTLIIDIILGLAAAAASLFFLYGAVPHKHIRVGIENYPPFIAIDKNGQLSGISADVIMAASAKNNLKVLHTGPSQLTQLLNSLANGTIDVVTSVAKTPEREEIALFTKPFMVVGTTMVSSVVSPKTVCVGKGFALEDWARQNLSQDIVVANDDAACVIMLQNGEVEAAAMDNLVLASHQLSLAFQKIPLGYSYSLAFAISKKRPELVPLFNSAIDEVM